MIWLLTGCFAPSPMSDLDAPRLTFDGELDRSGTTHTLWGEVLRNPDVSRPGEGTTLSVPMFTDAGELVWASFRFGRIADLTTGDVFPLHSREPAPGEVAVHWQEPEVGFESDPLQSDATSVQGALTVTGDATPITMTADFALGDERTILLGITWE